MGLEIAGAAAELAQVRSALRQERKRKWLHVTLAFAGYAVVLAATDEYIWPHWHQSNIVTWPLLYGAFLTAVRPSGRYRELRARYCELMKVRVLPELLSKVAGGGMGRLTDARFELHSALNMLTAQDAALIGPVQRQHLCTILAWSARGRLAYWAARPNPLFPRLPATQRRAQARTVRDEHNSEMARLCLRALAFAGDRTSVPVLRRVAETSKYADVRHDASSCLAWIEARGGDPPDVAALLRASAPGDTSDTLVRPAASAQAAAETLVRPADGEGA